MSKRDYAEEITSKKERIPPAPEFLGPDLRPFPTSRRWNLVSERVNKIKRILDLAVFLECGEKIDVLEKYADIHHEMSRYVPIGFVACIEGYFRLVYADLIDHGAPYRDNAAKCDVKLNLSVAISLQRRSLSLGEFVAHLLPTSSLENINDNMSMIIGGDKFTQRFREMRPKLQRQLTMLPIDHDEISNRVITGVKRLFKLRHMYCHEIDPVIPVREEDWMADGAWAAMEFLRTSEAIVNDLLSGQSSA